MAGAGKRGHYKAVGVARPNSPIKDRNSGFWLAKYIDTDGKRKQCGRYKTKTEAAARTREVVDERNRHRHSTSSDRTLVADFLEAWPSLYPRHPRTEETNRERITRYVLPHLPQQGQLPIAALSRPHLRAVVGALLDRGLSKTTIDGAMAALSAMLTDAVDHEIVDTNVAKGVRVRATDPRAAAAAAKRSKPKVVAPADLREFIRHVEPRYRPAIWMPAMTGCRAGELFAAGRADMDRATNRIFLHESAARYGEVMAGTKTTHNVPGKQERGRWTLFPPTLQAMFAAQPTSLGGRLVVTPRGKVFGQRNFYRDVIEPAREAADIEPFTLKDLRHSFASWLHAAGIPVAEVASWMGHSLRSGTTTLDVYTHATGTFDDVAIAVLEAVMLGDAATDGVGKATP